MVRCFVGYILPEDVKIRFVELQKVIEKWPMRCKFVERENLHLCFSFLGEIDENKITQISKSLDSIGEKFKKNEVKIDGLIPIPNQNFIRVLVLKIIESEYLNEILKEILNEIGGEAKPPHVTLCRIKSIEDKKEVKEKIKEEMKKDHGEFVIEAIQLIKSELKKTGPVYSIIHHVEFS
ncbi:MAG: RNA 2',3'-cyclic phosphodiesterase [Candidatus Aenigmatarchaeota archaeon]